MGRRLQNRSRILQDLLSKNLLGRRPLRFAAGKRREREIIGPMSGVLGILKRDYVATRSNGLL
jgi:hypothetical protein